MKPTIHHISSVLLCYALLCCALLIVEHPLASGQNLMRGNESYKVKKGDSLALIAAEYYGNREHKIYIMLENGFDHERALTPGKHLRIPVSHIVTIAEGDTLAALAKRYLGSKKRVKYLAEFNQLAPNGALALGQEIIIPMRVRYTAKGKEKLKDIALGLFADAKQARLLREYNDLDSNEIKSGQILSIPLPKIKIQASKRRPPNADASARASKRREIMKRAAISLPKARLAWTQGDFGTVKHEMTKLELNYLDAGIALDAGILLGAAYIAFDDQDSALATFAKVLRRSPEHSLNPKVHSPKVRKVWQQAKQNL